MKLLTGSSHPQVAQAIGQLLNLELAEVDISRFPNGEKRILIKESVKGHNIILVQTLSAPTDDHVIECLLMIDALERMGARHINLVIPWMGYSLQDKAFREGEPISAKVIANLFSNSYVKRVFLLDLHNSSIPGFFSVPTQLLTAMELFGEYAHSHFQLDNCVIASPDFGGLKRARVFAQKLNLPLINIDKHRDLSTGDVQALGMSGDVKGKSVIVYDDVINSGGTVVTVAEILKNNGAAQVHFFASHGPLVASALPKLEASQADSVVVTNSLPHTQNSPKLTVLDTASVFATELKTWL